MWYHICSSGFYPVWCCVCSPYCASGITDIGISYAKHVYIWGVGKIPNCVNDEDYVAGLCYKRKGPDFDYKAEYLRRKALGLA